MRAFILRKPFDIDNDSADPTYQHVEARLRVGITEPDAREPPDPSTFLEFVYDPGCDYTTVSASHLTSLNLDPEAFVGGYVDVINKESEYEADCPVRRVSLWLFSELPEWADKPLRINLSRGVVVVRDRAPGVPCMERPLLGMNTFLDARVKVELDYEGRWISVLIPSPAPTLPVPPPVRKCCSVRH
jgi:hypothetical protein